MSRSNPLSELERLLGTVSDGFDARALLEQIEVDVVDRSDEYVVRANLPGYEKSDIDVQVAGRALTVSAERETEAEAGTNRYVTRERTHRTVSRRVQLPGEVDEAGATASYETGVLTVTLPKRESERDRQIVVE